MSVMGTSTWSRAQDIPSCLRYVRALYINQCQKDEFTESRNPFASVQRLFVCSFAPPNHSRGSIWFIQKRRTGYTAYSSDDEETPVMQKSNNRRALPLTWRAL